MALTREQLKLAPLPKEAIQVDSLGGEVIVRALTLSERLALYSNAVAGADGFAHIARLLNVAVVDPAGKALMTVEEWEMFGGQNMLDAIRIFDVLRRLSGLDAEVVGKN